MSSTIPNFINGQVFQSRGDRTSPVFNPASGEQSGTLGLASAEDVSAAVVAAREAFPAWASTPPLRRARILNRFLRILEDRIDELAQVITAEHGKVLSDAKGEIQRGMEVVEFATGAPASKVKLPRTSAPASIPIRCGNRSGSSLASPHSIFR